jgi:uncharacterized membrane protein YbjE (DUF340 family)
MNTLIPFICLAAGAAISWRGLPKAVLKANDTITNVALIVLMLVIGLNIGVSPAVMGNLGRIGLNCAAITLSAIAVSVILTVLCEKTLLPLAETRKAFASEELRGSRTASEAGTTVSPLLIIMPLAIAIGIAAGYAKPDMFSEALLSRVLTISLIFLYLGVGVSLGENKSVFSYIKRLGARILLLPVAIFVGSILGGLLAGLALHVPLTYSVISASGAGYYSLTGATMTEVFGIEAGTYGFIVNVLRDVFTVLLMPILARISSGSPIASGAGGCMDTMLVPVTKAVGTELGMVALLSGTVLTFFVPVWLPIVCR